MGKDSSGADLIPRTLREGLMGGKKKRHAYHILQKKGQFSTGSPFKEGKALLWDAFTVKKQLGSIPGERRLRRTFIGHGKEGGSAILLIRTGAIVLERRK